MSASHLSRLGGVALGLVLLFLSAPSPVLSGPAVTEPPALVQKGLEAAMKARVNGLLEEKNEAGVPFKRGAWSKTFHKVDDKTYHGALSVDTAMGADLRSERFQVALTQDAAGAWSISKEELQDTYEGLHRGVIGDEACETYESLSFAREGLTIKSGPGSLCKDFYQGQVNRVALAAPDLSYQYEPPVPKEQGLFGLLKRERGSDLVFAPDLVWFQCDPQACELLLSTLVKGSTPVKEDQIDPVLRLGMEESRRQAEKSIRENPFAGYRLPYDPQRRFWLASIKKKGMGDHFFWLKHDSNDGREISVGATGFFGPIYSYYSAETRASGADPSELERRPEADARDYDLTALKGTVEMGFDKGEQLVGDVTYGLTTKRELRELPFAIARLTQGEDTKNVKNPRLFINSIQDGDGKELSWVKLGGYGGLVILPKAVPAGTSLTVRIQFESFDSIYKLTPSFSYVDRGGWLPFVRFSDMIHDFDLTVKVPAVYKTLGIGKKVSEAVADGANVTRWVGERPVTFPTVIFGQYNEAESGFKAKKKDGTEIPVRVHFDKDFMGQYQIAPKSLQKFADDAANALNLYREIFGIDYPFSKLDLVNDPAPALYGQAPSSLIYLGSTAFVGKGQLASGTQSATSTRLTKFVDSLVAHEVAHQWWGSLVVNSNFRNYWFVESLAEYSSALFTENVYGKKAYQEHIDSWRREIIENDMRSSVQDGYTVWAGPGGFGPYRAALYSKGPYAFHIMRVTWGDEKFFPFLKSLANDLAGKEIVTRDIQKVAEKSLGTNLDWFFDQWLRGVGLPQFTFDYAVREAEDGSFVVEGAIDQKVLLNPKEELPGQLFKGIVPITIVGKSGKEYRKKIIIEAARTPFKFNLPEKPKEITLNKYGEALGYDVVVKSEL